MGTRKQTVSMDMDKLTEREIDFLLEGLDAIENRPPDNPFGFDNPMMGMVMGQSREEVHEQIESKMRDIRIELRDRKRQIILLKAKLVTAQMNRLMELFTPAEEGVKAE